MRNCSKILRAGVETNVTMQKRTAAGGEARRLGAAGMLVVGIGMKAARDKWKNRKCMKFGQTRVAGLRVRR